MLSGGERARVALCKLLLEPYNLLVMDEPTNHLDITSKELLKKALNNYDGSLIVVSHDRVFLKGLTHKVYEFKNKNLKEYNGDIDFFLNEKEFNKLSKEQSIVCQNNKIHQASKPEKDLRKQIKKIQNKIKNLEKNIEILDATQKKIDLELSEPERFKELSKTEDFFKKYEEILQKKLSLEKEWEENINRLNDLQKEIQSSKL